MKTYSFSGEEALVLQEYWDTIKLNQLFIKRLVTHVASKRLNLDMENGKVQYFLENMTFTYEPKQPTAQPVKQEEEAPAPSPAPAFTEDKPIVSPFVSVDEPAETAALQPDQSSSPDPV